MGGITNPPGRGDFPSPPPSGPGTYPPPPPGAGPGAWASDGPFGPTPTSAAPGYAPAMAVEKAGFWSRFAAFVIDAIIVDLFFIPTWLALNLGPQRTTTCRVENGDITGFGDEPNALCRVPTGGTIALTIVLALVAIVAAVVYYGKLDGGPRGQTIGKRALGIRVVDKYTGGPIGTARGVGRYFARILSALACYLGYLWMLWDPEKQCWHDKLVNDYVVKV
jgi:uncharacterized RDD family membrane protein YckC